MKKIVILGCENSHADIFLGFIKNDAAFSDVEVSGVYSDDKTAAEKLAEKYGVKVMSAYDEAVGKVDGVIVTARHGNNHYKYAAPYIKTGVPMFIDKPITVNEGEALKLARECKAAGVEVVYPSEKRQNDVMSLIYDDVKAGREPDMDKFDRVMWEFARSGCDRVILACTELSVLQKYREMPEITLDAMDVLVRESIIRSGAPYRL